MDQHPKYCEVAELCEQFPQRSRALFQTFLDIKYGQMLPRVATNVLAKADLPVVISEEPNGTSNVFVPVYADESISMDLLAQILSDSAELFKEGFNGHATNFNMQTHLAIVESDSTVVYYKTALGISVATPSSDIYLT
ncbi:hypothetical protein GGI25_003592 [Coemansia spiralis]|uniref:tRNA-splicing endonuclease subunit Sen15 domain-containing protein n=2 Tax=Coemansia TaxID=4863 RepID=A0A9W8G6X3_9FUNG|nr:hypothetical protein BX070DRAFT_226764 [Coemansia spiralis]KAJ1991148.1 hypothetical protein EDC05_003626 [Coemansia umbellata]KAJ2676442.1 hypothetical protein GGI25_003592 [Coemansia spiralis]